MNIDSERVQMLFFDALDRPTSERGAFLREQCAKQPDLLEQVLELLRAEEADGAEEFLSEPLLARAARPVPTEIAPGLPRRLGRYELLQIIGRGGMGVVYRARDHDQQRDVALKILAPLANLDPAAQKRFEREIHALQRLDDPHIVRALGADTIDETLVLVMEFVAGENLQNVVAARGPLGAAEACGLMAQAARGLQHAHECGVVHRDIKPSNLMLTPAGTVKILDLGLALVLGSVPGLEALTKTGMVMGTPDFMAPEQVRSGKTVDARADLYSLGATLYFLLTGRAPFADHSTSAAKIRALETIQPTALNRPDVPAPLAALLGRLLAKDPHARPGSAAAVAAALEAIANHTEPVARSAGDVSARFSLSAWAIFTFLLSGTIGFAAHILYQLTRTGEELMATDADILKLRVEIVVLICSLFGVLCGVLRYCTKRRWLSIPLAFMALPLVLLAVAWDWPPLLRSFLVESCDSVSQRPRLGLAHEWKAMQRHQAGLNRNVQASQRYITLRHLHDNPSVSDAELDAWRDGVRTLANKLQSGLKLATIDSAATVFVFDLDADPRFDVLWPEITAGCPTGRLLDKHAAPELRDAARDVLMRTGTLLPAVPGDWLISVTLPQSELAARYRADVDSATAAAELGCTVEELRKLLADELQLKTLGLDHWTRGGKIPRDDWIGQAGADTRFQIVADWLGLGYPLRR